VRRKGQLSGTVETFGQQWCRRQGFFKKNHTWRLEKKGKPEKVRGQILGAVEIFELTKSSKFGGKTIERKMGCCGKKTQSSKIATRYVQQSPKAPRSFETVVWESSRGRENGRGGRSIPGLRIG